MIEKLYGNIPSYGKSYFTEKWLRICSKELSYLKEVE